MAKVLEAYITSGQIKMIKVLQRDLGIEDDDYRDILIKRFRVTSCTQLTVRQATRLIEHFQGLNNGGDQETRRRRRTPYTRNRDGKVVRMASTKERRKITALSLLVDWEFEDGLQRWSKKRFGIEKVKTSAEAYLVIEGLKKMIANAMAKQHGEAWWCKWFDDEGIMRFIEEHCPEEYR